MRRDNGSPGTSMTAASASIRSLLAAATRELATTTARLDAEVLLADCLTRPRSYLYAWPERAIAAQQRQQFLRRVQRRAAGEPVAYLTGRREFWSLSLAVTPDTLIPRPETETLVALALEKMAPERALRVADLGTGCGAIALAIASERPHCRVLATDISPAALAVASDNAGRCGIDNVRFIAGAWCAALAAERFDIIVSNPPYVAAADPHLEQGDVRYEPRLALVSGPHGLDDLERLIGCARNHLHADGWLLVEHGCDQDTPVRQLFAAAGYRDIGNQPDAAGRSRVTLGRL
jgi:release factor glutamine methyltransferase